MKKIFIIAVIVCGCNASRKATLQPVPPAGISINGKLFSTIYQQKAAEYRALCFQAYNIAKLRLDQYKPLTVKPLAIITDIDETILNNSFYQAHQALQGKDYDPVSWNEWTTKAAADTVPGAAAFLTYAASKGIEIFYVTNRGEQERKSTIKNLQQFNLPDIDDVHFIPRKDTSSKELRRNAIAATHEVVMLIGDNLSDFTNLFDKKQLTERLSNTNYSEKEFGDRFIVLPNPVYGDWEASLYKFKRLKEPQKDSVIRSEVKGY